MKFHQRLWHQKTGVPGLSCGVVFVIICLAILVQYRLASDGQTDRQTYHDDISAYAVVLCLSVCLSVHLSVDSRGKNRYGSDETIQRTVRGFSRDERKEFAVGKM